MNSRVKQQGQIIPLVAICLVVLIGFAAFAVDVGYLRYEQRLQQTAADDAALAAADQLRFDPTKDLSAAQADAAKNGFDPVNDTNVHMSFYDLNSASHGPADGSYQGDPNAVEVILADTHPAFFSGIWGSTNTITARAVARVEDDRRPACFYVLGMNGNPSQLNIDSVHTALNLPTCGVMVNGKVSGQNGTVVATYVAATGSISLGQPTTATLLPNIPPFNDPCSAIPGCSALVAAYTADPNIGESAAVAPPSYDATKGLPPGHYTTWPSVTGTLCLQGGLFIVDSARTSADLVGPGLTPLGQLNNPCPPSPPSETSGVTIVAPNGGVGNGSNSNLVSPNQVIGIDPTCNSITFTCVGRDKGAPGMLYYVPCNCTMPWNFSSNSQIGMMYFPQVHITLNGSCTTLSSTFLVFGEVIGNCLDLFVPATSSGNPAQQLQTLVE